MCVAIMTALCGRRRVKWFALRRTHRLYRRCTLATSWREEQAWYERLRKHAHHLPLGSNWRGSPGPFTFCAAQHGVLRMAPALLAHLPHASASFCRSRCVPPHRSHVWRRREANGEEGNVRTWGASLPPPLPHRAYGVCVPAWCMNPRAALLGVKAHMFRGIFGENGRRRRTHLCACASASPGSAFARYARLTRHTCLRAACAACIRSFRISAPSHRR